MNIFLLFKFYRDSQTGEESNSAPARTTALCPAVPLVALSMDDGSLADAGKSIDVQTESGSDDDGADETRKKRRGVSVTTCCYHWRSDTSWNGREGNRNSLHPL